MLEKPLPYFIVGGTLTGNAASYVERQADADLFAALLAGELCYVLDTRQVGKSSLIVHTAQKLRGTGQHTVHLDLSTFGNTPTEEQWYGKLLADVARALDLEDEADAFWEEKTQFSSAQRWFLAVRDLILPRLTTPLVVFVDEIDAVRNLPFSTDAFLAMIRALCNLRAHEADAERLTFCLVGVATPADLIRDTRTTPFNIGRRIELHDFTLSETLALAQGLCGTLPQQQEQIRRIHRWTNGHPYLTQLFCMAAADRKRALTVREMDALCREVFLCKRAQSEETNLHFVRRQLLDDPAASDLLLRYGRLRAGRRVWAGSADALTDRLLLSGVARIDADREPPRLAVRNRIYAHVFDHHWVRANLPDAEQRRQRHALHLGILRASLVWCGVASVLLFALARQQEVGRQQARIAGLSNTLHTQQGALERKTQEVAAAGKDLEAVLADIERQRREQRELEKTAHTMEWDSQKMQRDNRNEHRRLVQTQREQRRATVTIDRLQQDAGRIRENSEVKRHAALALMGAAISGQEFDALEHGLQAVAPTVRRHIPPSSEALQGLGSAATAGVYRLFRLQHPFRLETADISVDGRLIATAGLSRFVYLWDAQTGRKVGQVTALPKSYLEPRVWTAEFSPDGKYLVTTGRNGVARVWDATTLRQSAPRLVWETPCPVSGAYTSRERIVAHFSPSGRYLAVSAVVTEDNKDSYSVTVWDVRTHTPLKTLHHDGVIRSLAFNHLSLKPDQEERYLAVAGGSHTARIFEFRTGEETFQHRYENSNVQAVAFTRWSDGVYLSYEDGRTESWGWNKETETGPVRDWKPYLQKTYLLHPGDVPSLAVSYDGFLLASADARDCAVHVWYREYEARPIYSLRSHVAPVQSVRFSHNGSRLVTASQDNTAEVWLLAAPLYTISGGKLHGVALSPDGSILVAPSKDYNGTGGRVFFWEAAGHATHMTEWSRYVCGILNEHGGEIAGPVYQAVYSPDGKRLATAGDGGSVLIWNLKDRTGRDTHDRLNLEGHTPKYKVNCVAFSPDCRLLLSGSNDDSAILWDARTGKALRTYRHDQPRSADHYEAYHVNSVAFAPDGKGFLTGCTDGTARLYTLDGRLVRRMQPLGPRGWTPHRYPWSVCFSPDGRTLLTGDADGNAYLWEHISGKLLATLPYGHGQVFSAQFSPDGRHVLTVGEGGYADIWDVSAAEDATCRRQVVAPFLSRRVSTASLCGGQFSHDGQYVFVGGEDGLARKYPATAEAIIQEAQRIRRLGNKPVPLSESNKSPDGARR